MIVCSCRTISDKDYKTKEELLNRLLEDDRDCCVCIQGLVKDIKCCQDLTNDSNRAINKQ